MRNLPRVFFPAACALFFAHAYAASPGPDAKPAGIPLAPVVSPELIIAPTEVRTDPTLAKGCWVRLFPEPAFKGTDDLTIAGPVALPSLHTPAGGVYWKHKTESVIVGPKATVSIFENQRYSHQTATLAPGTREPQLRGNLKFTQSIDSLKIDCAP
ncbi:hypothetical protein [Noviherbaspirillum pedocola]|uniref:Uncharacterized protein n=1 Tax=Noviherbaspirillum pedocola TaxID=2801341 RepID=A0A934SWX9_9BURK|nr:hypothetical protein [Noviherbaspirillum pedocola]MBK4736581.1 hypothetical protein [Noviherbaspirillum pedocola]